MNNDGSSPILNALREVVDPELGINLVDLGLIYHISQEGTGVRVEMTMTSPACPMGSMLQEQATEAIRKQMPGLSEVTVQLVWSPPWHAGLMSDVARQQLGWAD